jgi:hypothetical protein
MQPNPTLRAVLVTAALALAGCTGIPSDALKLGPDPMANRDIQTRAFRAGKESELLAASAGVLQDLGFTLDDSEPKLGLISATKTASAMNQVDNAVATLGKIINLGLGPTYLKTQTIRVSLVVRPPPPGAAREPSVRVTFQRRVRDERGMTLIAEQLNDPRLYEEFYARLGKSVFLETSTP